MVKSKLINRIGSKTNDIKFFKHLLPMDIKNVIEPFGGSFALINDVYNDDKYNKFVNDNDEALFYIYKNPDELIDAYNQYNIINNNTSLRPIEKKDAINALNISPFLKTYILNSMFVRGIISKKKNVNNANDDVNFMKKINFSFDDAFDVINRFKGDENSFIFLDPPYLFSDNSNYEIQKGNGDCTDYYIKFNELLRDKNIKAKIMLIVNDMKILRWLYSDLIKMEYKKTYQIAKKMAVHLVITNY